MTNNDILKKLRVALQLRDEQIIDILGLVDFRISKGEIGNFFRAEDHPKYMECQDQILRNFLNGLVIYLRGTKENPKNPKEVLKEVASTKVPLTEKSAPEDKPKKTVDYKKSTTKTAFKEKKSTTTKGNTGKSSTSVPTKKDILGNFKYNNGKQKKKD